MGILDVYADSIERNTLTDLSRAKAETPPSFSAWAAAKSIPGAVTAGGTEVAGSLADLLSSFGTTYAATFGTGADSDAAAKRMREGDTFDTAAGNVLRKKAEDFMPDPHTAHWSTQAVAQFGRFGAKAVGSIGTFGPLVGPALLAAEESNTQTQALIAKGIDPATATLAGMTQGTISGFGAGLPLAGTGLAQTAGLVFLGGPGSFMAQEALQKKILQDADYGAEAALHDPFDPVGLAVSTLVPAGFGAMGLRSAAKAAAKAREAAKPLESVKTEAEARAAAQLTPEEQAASDALERSDANLTELRQAIAKEKSPENRATLEAELAKQEKAALAAHSERAASIPEATDAARVALLDSAVARSLPDEPHALALMKQAQDAVAAGDRPEMVDMPTRDMRAAMDTAITLEAQIRQASKDDETYARLMGTQVERLRSEAQAAPTEDIARRWNTAADMLEQKVRGQEIEPPQSPRVVTQTREVSAFEPAPVAEPRAKSEPKLTEPPKPEPSAYRSALDQALSAVKEKPAGQVVAEAKANGSLTQLLHNAIAAVEETGGNAKRLNDIAAHAEDIAKNSPTMQPGDVLADAIERVRLGQEAPKAEPLTPDQARLAAIAQKNPDMPVILPGQDKPMSLRDAIAQVKKELEADLSNADLVRAAAACALSLGA